eukprot:NODE_118_length_18907_cov_0.436251.p2 type:complete len:500 gc:universal NODE_118_length_18907_cov_0.436251:10369-8870(-)
MLLLFRLYALTCVSNTCSNEENPDCITFKATIRDFPQHAMDFESPIDSSGFPQKGLLNGTMDSMSRPNFSPWRIRQSSASGVTYGNNNFFEAAALVNYGQFFFDHYYMDVPLLNIPYEVNIDLKKNAQGFYVYDSNDNTYNLAIGSTNGFFPLDGIGYTEEFFGNQGHNYWYTTHVSYPFYYRGAERFSFSGDDDLYVFIDKKLALACDLGGIHQNSTCELALDTILDPTKDSNKTYQLDVYHAERHTVESNFKITTSVLPKNIPPTSQNTTEIVSGSSTNQITLPTYDGNNDQLIIVIHRPFPKYGTLQFGKLNINNNSLASTYSLTESRFIYAAGGENGIDSIYYTVKDNCVESEMFRADLNVTVLVKPRNKPILRDTFTVLIDQNQVIENINLTARDIDNNTLFYLDDKDYASIWSGCITVLLLNQTSGMLGVQGIAGSCNYTYLVSNKVYDPPSRGIVQFIVKCLLNCEKQKIVTVGDAGPTNEVYLFGDPATST